MAGADTPPKLKRPLRDAQDLAKEALTCIVCFELIRPPIQQCPEGHAICDGCFEQLPLVQRGSRSCPTCRTVYPGKRIRNLIADQMAELLSYPCIYAKRGCKEMLPPSDLDAHIKTCNFDPNRMRCPNCSWVGLTKDLKEHVSTMGWFHIPTLSGKLIGNEFWVQQTLRMEWSDIISEIVQTFEREDPPIFFFAGEVFQLHAVKCGESLKIGVRQLSPRKDDGGFSSMVLVEGSSNMDSVVRNCSAISTASSEDELMKETKRLCLDMDTVMSLCVGKQNMFENVVRPTLRLKCKITKKR